MIASHVFHPKEGESWLCIALEKRIQYGKARIDSIKIKIKVKNQIRSNSSVSNGLNVINHMGNTQANVNANPNANVNLEQKKDQLNNLIRELLKTPLFNNSNTSSNTNNNNLNITFDDNGTTYPNSITNSNSNKRSESVNQQGYIKNKNRRNKLISNNEDNSNSNNNHNNNNNTNIQRLNTTNTINKPKQSHSRQSNSQHNNKTNHNTQSLFKSIKRKSYESNRGILHKDISDSTTFSTNNSKTPNKNYPIKRLFLSKHSGSTTDANTNTNNDYISSTRDSLPDNNRERDKDEFILLRQQIEDNFNDVMNQERDLIQNDALLFEIEPSISYFMNDLLMDDDYDEIRQTQFEEFSNNFQQCYSKGYYDTISLRSLLKTEADVLLNKITTMRNGYRLRAKEYQEQFGKYKELFIYYSEKYIHLSKMYGRLKQLNEERSISIKANESIGELKDNIVKANRRELDILNVAFGHKHKEGNNKGKKGKDNKPIEKLSQIVMIALKNSNDKVKKRSKSISRSRSKSRSRGKGVIEVISEKKEVEVLKPNEGVGGGNRNSICFNKTHSKTYNERKIKKKIKGNYSIIDNREKTQCL